MGDLRIVNWSELLEKKGGLVLHEHGSFIYPRMYNASRRDSNILTFYAFTLHLLLFHDIAGEDRVPLTIIVIADLNSDDGLDLIKEVLRSMVRLVQISPTENQCSSVDRGKPSSDFICTQSFRRDPSS